jgi:hypothetical protein
LVGYRETVSENLTRAERAVVRQLVEALAKSDARDASRLPPALQQLDDLLKGGLLEGPAIERFDQMIREYTRASADVILASPPYLLALDHYSTAPHPPAAAKPTASVSRRPPVHLVVVVLIWLILLAGPLADGKLPSEIQAMLGSEIGTISMALALTQTINQKRK